MAQRPFNDYPEKRGQTVPPPTVVASAGDVSAVADAVALMDARVTVLEEAGSGSTSLELDGGDAVGSDGSFEIDGGGA